MAAAREWFEKDYYKVLGVSAGADAKEITRAYRKLARQYHPDANPGDAGAEERFKELSSAYDVLGDPDKRLEYDEVRRMAPSGNLFGGAPGGFGGRGPAGFRVRSDDAGDLGDLFSGLFGRAAPGRGDVRSSPLRGNDLEAELHLAFLDAVVGVTTAVNLVGQAPCSTCDGSGAAAGTTPVVCERCGGRGVLDDNQGFFSFSQPCPVCRGTGSKVEHPCGTCSGSGLERRPREVKVRVPAGVEDGQRIRLAGRGEPGRAGAPAGDLLVLVHVAAHEQFGRRGRDLTLTMPITYPEAVLGTELEVAVLTGSSLTLRVPAGTRSGRTFRVRGRGIDTRQGAGDLLVTVEILVPTNPSARERKLLEDLARLGTAGLEDRPEPDAGRPRPSC